MIELCIGLVASAALEICDLCHLKCMIELCIGLVASAALEKHGGLYIGQAL